MIEYEFNRKRDRDIVAQEKEHSRRKNLQTKEALSTSTMTGEERVANNIRSNPREFKWILVRDTSIESVTIEISRGHHCREKHGRR